MAGRAYYNEIDPYAAAWLRNLIAAGCITAGDVDERSIVDVRPSDLEGYERCHFFAGIGVWDFALNLAGWPVGLPVWTGSCPCQPFSAAGRKGGVSDERHLWPAFFHLIEMVRPAVVLGEQVASKDGLDWLDLVQADLEGAHYDVAAADLCAAGVGAPHIRQRLWFVADATGEGQRYAEDPRADRGYPSALQGGGQGQSGLREPQRGGAAGGMGDAERFGVRGPRRGSDVGAAGGVPHPHGERQRLRDEPRSAGSVVGVAHSGGGGRQGAVRPELQGLSAGQHQSAGGRSRAPWADLEWLPCRDGKARPTQPGLQPLAHGAPARVGRLRAYGNAINAEAAAAFIGAVIDTLSPSSNPIPHGKRDGGGL